MKLADKIIVLRKKQGWSQEELADRLDVTRQSVSKWEGAQSVPELEKIVAMSELFGVSTDFLLKEDAVETSPAEKIEGNEKAAGNEAAKPNATETETDDGFRKVSADEVEGYFERKKKVSTGTAVATALCVLSPVTLITLAGFSDERRFLTEPMAAGIGLLMLFAMVAVAVALFILGASRLERFAYLEKDGFRLESRARETAECYWRENEGRCIRFRIIATVLCVLSVTPLFGALLFEEESYAALLSVPMLLILVSAGVFMFVLSGERWGCAEALLKREGIPREDAKWAKIKDTVGSVYWLVAVAVYLGYSFVTDDWGESWVIWPIAGVAFAALAAVMDLFGKKKP